MLKTEDVMTTVRMLQEENLDVRTVTMGIHIGDCACGESERTAQAVADKIHRSAGALVETCDRIAAKYGLPIVNKRLAVSPVSDLLEGHEPAAALRLAEAVDDVAAGIGIDLVGGFTALVENGFTPGKELLLEALPDILGNTRRVCGSVNVGTVRDGVNCDACNRSARAILGAAEATAEASGFGAAKLVVFTNAPSNNPFMAGAFLGAGQPERVINVGVSGPGVVKRAIAALLEQYPEATLDEMAEQIKHTAFRVTRAGELVGREVAAALDIPFGAVDLSLAPAPQVGDSVGEVYQAMGVHNLGAPGTTAAVALLNDAVKKGGTFASSSVGGLSGAFIPVTEDPAVSQAVGDGYLNMEKLEAMTAVCSVGIDMVLMPGDTAEAALAGIILDEAAIGNTNRKTTGVRIIPVPGGQAGDYVDFGGLFGAGTITDAHCAQGAEAFVRRGGHIPAPVHSLTN